MIHLTWLHMIRHWRLNLALLLCLTAACALAAVLSGYADAIAARELSRTWEAASPSDRTLLVTGARDALSDARYTDLQTKLGGLVRDRLVVRWSSLVPDTANQTPVPSWAPFIPGSSLPPTEEPTPAAQGTRPAMARLMVYSFEPLAENVRVVEGKLPEALDLQKNAEPWRPPPIQVAIGAPAAAQTGYRVGDQLTATSKYHRLEIVGIVEPLDPHADLWGQDLSPFALIAPVTDTLPLIVNAHSMEIAYPLRPVFPHEISWRISLDAQKLDIRNVAAFYSNLINLQTQSASAGITTRTGLVSVLGDYLARWSRLQIVFTLLAVQALVAVWYALALFASIVVDRSRAEFATLSARGASRRQMTLVLALEGLVLSAGAVLLSPALALLGRSLWSSATGSLTTISAATETWMLSGLVAALGWLAILLSVVRAVRNPVRLAERGYARPLAKSLLQTRYLDIYLFLFGALLYWQLSQRDSLVMSGLRQTFMADPLLLIGPSILVIAGAMVLLRIVPLFFQLVLRVARNTRGWTLAHALARLSRDTTPPNQMILLVSLTAGLVLFALTLGNALAASPESMSRDMASALQLDALVLVVFSGSIFFVANLAVAQARARESGVLRMLGLSPRQWVAGLVMEAAFAVAVGLAAGAVVGISLSFIMTPYLAQALAGWELGAVIERATVNGPVLAQSYAALLSVYGGALVLLGLALIRSAKARSVWKEDD